MVLACTIFANEALGAKTVAVYAVGEIPNDSKSTICSAVLARLSGNKEYQAFERNKAFIDALNKEQDYQTSGEVPEKEIRGVGQRLGVDYVIVVDTQITPDDICYMSARLIELATGKVIKTSSIQRDYTGSDVISSMANNIAYRLLNAKSK